MPKKDLRIDAYIAKAADFAKPILKHIRKTVHAACPEVEETLKWSFPHFLHKGMLCSMAAFNEHCALGFWKASLILGKEAGEGAMGHFGRITKLSELPPNKVLIGYIRKAVRLNEEGVRLPPRAGPRKRVALVIPDEMKSALKKNKKALKTFENFSYSHQKEYVEWITEAKREETRAQRLKTTLQWLVEGKSRHWKYARC